MPVEPVVDPVVDSGRIGIPDAVEAAPVITAMPSGHAATLGTNLLSWLHAGNGGDPPGTGGLGGYGGKATAIGGGTAIDGANGTPTPP